MPLFDSNSQAETFLGQAPSLALVRNLSFGLNEAAKGSIVDQVLCLVRDYYVHLPLKTSSLAIDPVRELELLLDDIPYIQTDSEFFYRMLGTIKRLRDRHTCLKLPPPLSGAVAFLPFAVESFWEGDRRPLIVSKLLANIDDGDFVPGVEVTHWSGVPIAKYIERLSWENEGANPFARIAIALRSLTIRPLAYMLPPDEDWVTLSYVANSQPKTISIPWQVYFPSAGSGAERSLAEAVSGDVTAKGLDRASYLVNGGWQDLYSAGSSEALDGVFLEQDPLADVPNPLKDNLYFRLVRYGTTLFGYVRIFSFDTPDARAFLVSFAEILRLMPRSGLIIDVRANPGGTIPAGEGLLQLLSPKPIQAEKVAFRITSNIQKLAMSSPFFEPWRRSLNLRYETGGIFSQGFTLYDPTLADDLVGSYRNPVVLIVDALSYSATDFFAAGFQDNGIGKVIGTDIMSGAGGANVWTHSQLQQAAMAAGDNSLIVMPAGVDMNLALRRSARVGVNDEIPVEGIGILADHFYRVTRRDVMGRNEDLIYFAGYVLSQAT
jgi:hypothetical protein